MYPRWSAFFGACLSTLVGGLCLADEMSEDRQLEASHNWVGGLTQQKTRNGSTLSEYRSQTSSVNSPNTFLVISMWPRFSCDPVVSIEVANTVFGNDPNAVSLSVTIGGQSEVPFPVLIDRSESGALLTLREGQSAHNALRSLMDTESWVHFDWMVDAPALSNVGDGIVASPSQGQFDFSLLGSRVTVLNMERRCQNHVPIPYSN